MGGQPGDTAARNASRLISDVIGRDGLTDGLQQRSQPGAMSTKRL